MSLFDRLLLALYTLILTVIIALSAVETAGLYPVHVFYQNLPITKAQIFGAVGVLLLAGIRLFWISIRSSEATPRSGGRHVILKEGALGQVKVSVQAIENLVIKVASQMDGVKDVKPRIFSSEKGVGVKIQASVSPDLNIPETTEQMQNLVKEKVLAVTGVTIASVEINVESIIVAKPRVE